jgi:hypothetical protein
LLKGGEEGCAEETLGEAELENCDLEGPVDGLEEDPLLKNSLARRRRRARRKPTAPSSPDPKARRRGSDEEGCDERLGDTELAHGQLRRPVQGANQELEECLLRRLALLTGDEEACAGALLGDADGQELEGRLIAQKQPCSKTMKRAGSKHWATQSSHMASSKAR